MDKEMRMYTDFMDGINNRCEHFEPFTMPMDRTEPYGGEKLDVIKEHYNAFMRKRAGHE